MGVRKASLRLKGDYRCMSVYAIGGRGGGVPFEVHASQSWKGFHGIFLPETLIIIIVYAPNQEIANVKYAKSFNLYHFKSPSLGWRYHRNSTSYASGILLLYALVRVYTCFASVGIFSKEYRKLHLFITHNNCEQLKNICESALQFNDVAGVVYNWM